MASLCIVLTIFIKLFGVVAFVLFLFYPEKPKAIIYTIGWTLLFIALPLIVVSPEHLYLLYHSWYHLLSNDYSISYGLSFAGWLHSWFSLNVPKNLIAIAGAVILLIPALKFRHYKDLTFRLLFLSSTLLWMVIFNYKAESPTFIIAMSGVAIWFFCQKSNTINITLLILALILTSLSSTDLFPKSIREAYVMPYVLKAVPCILIWIKVMYDLIALPIKNNRYD